MTRCSRCARPTEWDAALGPESLCVTCWDKAAAAVEIEYQARYYLAHKGRGKHT